MFRRRKNNATKRVLCIAITLFTSSGCAIFAQTKATVSKLKNEKNVHLIGHVLARSLLPPLGAGVGPVYEPFVFAVSVDGASHIMQVKVFYAIYHSNGTLPDSFFDYSKSYELQAVREPTCDETINGLFFAEGKGRSGKALKPISVMRLLDGVPKDSLKLDAILPCYILRPGKYKILNEKNGVTPSTPTTP